MSASDFSILEIGQKGELKREKKRDFRVFHLRCHLSIGQTKRKRKLLEEEQGRLEICTSTERIIAVNVTLEDRAYPDQQRQPLGRRKPSKCRHEIQF